MSVNSHATINAMAGDQSLIGLFPGHVLVNSAYKGSLLKAISLFVQLVGALCGNVFKITEVVI